MSASHQDRVCNLIDELWDLLNEHVVEHVERDPDTILIRLEAGPLLRALAERVVAAEDKASGVIKIKDAG